MENISIYFSTYTNLNWIPVLENDEYKNIVVDSLRFLVSNGRVTIYGFVIMPNHVHLIWKINEGFKLNEIQRDFLKFTAQMIKFKMLNFNGMVDPKLVVDACDRKVQIWERNGLSFPLYNYRTIVQKLSYVHKNPINKKWNLCESLDRYKYSSFRFYLNGDKEFDFLTDIYEIEQTTDENSTITGVAC